MLPDMSLVGVLIQLASLLSGCTEEAGSRSGGSRDFVAAARTVPLASAGKPGTVRPCLHDLSRVRVVNC